MVSFSAPLSMNRSDITAKNRTTARIMETQIYDCLMLTEESVAKPLGVVVVVVRTGVERLMAAEEGTVGSWARASLRVVTSSVEETEVVTKWSKGRWGTEEEAEGQGEKKERPYLYHFILIL